MRVMQPWAGAAWGAQFIPRIGMEVVVSFLGGDVDRPVVMGTVYNAANLPPDRLPEKKTQSGIRTHSTPGGGGYNEILFEDAKGGELLSIRAQRNLDESASNDVRSTAGRDHTIAAGRNAARDVGGRTTPCTSAATGPFASTARSSSRSRGDPARRSQAIGWCGSAETTRWRPRGIHLASRDVRPCAHRSCQQGRRSRPRARQRELPSRGGRRAGAVGEERDPALLRRERDRDHAGQREDLHTQLELAVTEGLVCKGKENTISIGDHIEIKGDLVS